MAQAIEKIIDKSPKVDLERFHMLKDIEVSEKQIKQELKELRAPEHVNELKHRIVQLARIFSRNYNIRVLPSDDGRWSLAVDPEAIDATRDLLSGQRDTIMDMPAEKFSPKAILYNVDDIALSSEEEVLARLRHAASHARNTDFRHIFEVQKIAETEGNLPSSFGLAQLGCEDVRVYNKDNGDSQAAREKLKQNFGPRYQEILVKINEQPLIRQAMANALYGQWLHGENIPTMRDPRVIEASQRLAPLMKRYSAVPSSENAFQILKEEILPEVQALEKLAIEDEVKRIVWEEVAERYEKEERRERNIAFKFVRVMADNPVSRTFKRIFRIKPSQNQEPPRIQEVEDIVDANGADLMRDSLADTRKLQEETFDERNDNLRSRSAQVGYFRDALDLTELNPDLKQTLDKIHTGISATLREELEHDARNRLRDAQSEALRHELPVGLSVKKRDKKDQSSENPEFEEPHSEREISRLDKAIEELARSLGIIDYAALEDAAAATVSSSEVREQELNEAKALRKEMHKRELQKHGFTEEELEHYQNFKLLEQSVIGKLDGFLEQLLPHLPRKRTFDYGDETHFSGTRLDRKAVVKRIPVGDYRIYNRRVPVDSLEPKMFVTLLIDNSGSMQGQKMRESVKTAIFWARALKEMNVPFAIRLFGERVTELKGFKQDYDDPNAKIKSNLVQRTTANEGSTNISRPLEESFEEMLLERRRHPDSLGAIFVISDSGANRGKTGAKLQELVRQVQSKFMVTNFILTEFEKEVENAKSYFGGHNVVAPRDFSELPEESMRVLRSTLREAFRTT